MLKWEYLYGNINSSKYQVKELITLYLVTYLILTKQSVDTVACRQTGTRLACLNNLTNTRVFVIIHSAYCPATPISPDYHQSWHVKWGHRRCRSHAEVHPVKLTQQDTTHRVFICRYTDKIMTLNDPKSSNSGINMCKVISLHDRYQICDWR